QRPRSKVYMDYNATTPLEAEVVQTITEALQEAWGNPSSTYPAGVKAKAMIKKSRESVARLVGGEADDIIFTSGGTEANNMVFHTAVEHFWRNWEAAQETHRHLNENRVFPHIVTSNVEHDSVKLAAEYLQENRKADVTFISVSQETAHVEVQDIIAAVRPNTCLISIMLANNETGVIMPIQEICSRVKAMNKKREKLRILLHTDAAQALGKIPVNARELGVDFLTIVGHKFYGPRIGALYVNGPNTRTPLYPMLFGVKNAVQGLKYFWVSIISALLCFYQAAELVTNNLLDYEAHMQKTRLYLEERLKAVFKDKIHFNSHYPGSDILPNTCNVSILGPGLQGWRVLSNCTRLLASVGAACHSDSGDKPSDILLSCGIPVAVAANAVRLSLGRGTTKADVDAVVEDLKETVQLLC
uniref:Selenocysteine lyase n=1 Tax=Takifugu rubripes TaxID=31033 RepID=A0A674P3Y1_TAKRU